MGEDVRVSPSGYTLSRVDYEPRPSRGAQLIHFHLRCPCPREHVVSFEKPLNRGIDLNELVTALEHEFESCACLVAHRGESERAPEPEQEPEVAPEPLPEPSEDPPPVVVDTGEPEATDAPPEVAPE